MRIHDPKNIEPLEKLYVVLSIDEDGNEGLVAAPNEVGLGMEPLISAELSIINEMLKRVRKDFGHLTEKKMHIATFVRE